MSILIRIQLNQTLDTKIGTLPVGEPTGIVAARSSRLLWPVLMNRGFLDLPPEAERPSSEGCSKHRIIFGKLVHGIRGKHSQDVKTRNYNMPICPWTTKLRVFIDKCSQKWNRFIDIDRDGPWDAKIEMTKLMMYSNIMWRHQGIWSMTPSIFESNMSRNRAQGMTHILYGKITVNNFQ